MKKAILACWIVLLLLLTGCDTGFFSNASSHGSSSSPTSFHSDPIDIADPKSEPSKQTGGRYGRRALPPELKRAYDLLEGAMLSCTEAVELPLMEQATLSRVLTYVRRDHPEISWLDGRFSYIVDLQRELCRVTLSYTRSPAAVQDELTQIADAAEHLTANISPELPDFDKALLLFDRLCEWVEYDLQGERQSELAGALLDGRASCGGYAKAYQYLLQKLGMEALIVYGTANEPHAWNIVRLNGNYYLADPTWGDAALEDGTSYLSHCWLFLNDEAFEKTHTPLTDGTNYPLPECDSFIQNYFVKTGTLVRSAEEQERIDAVSAAFDLAAAHQYKAVQIAFADGLPLQSYLEDGSLDRLARHAAGKKGMTVYGRALDGSGNVVSYFVRENTPPDDDEGAVQNRLFAN